MTSRFLQPSYLALSLSAAVAVAGALYSVHDTVIFAAAIAAAGLPFVFRGAKVIVPAAALLSLGLAYSSLDTTGCSIWFRGRVVVDKLAAAYPAVSWTDVGRFLVSYSHCYSQYKPRKVGDQVVDGVRLEQFETSEGKFWIAGGQGELLEFLLTEIFAGRDYENQDVEIRPGDVVIDCGAHVGVFTRYALKQGAQRVIAIEPVPSNLACLERNLQDEIRAGRVTVVRAGVWYEAAELTIDLHPENSGAHSFVRDEFRMPRTINLPVRPLQDIVEELDLVQVDFIKMDIEGAERHALRGAVRTLQRFRPRMAICTYHTGDDPSVIPDVVSRIHPGYELTWRYAGTADGSIVPKVAFFMPSNTGDPGSGGAQSGFQLDGLKTVRNGASMPGGLARTSWGSGS